MKKLNEKFAAKVAEALVKLPGGKLTMDSLKVVDNRIVVHVDGLASGGLHTPVLQIVERSSSLFIEAHNLARFGSPGSYMNYAPQYLLHEALFDDIKGRGENGHLDLFQMRMLVNAYLTSTHTSDELLATVVQASNANTVFTHAIKDYRDGEVYVRAHVRCDFISVPDDFEFIVRAVLDHSARIRRFVLIMRELALPDTTNWQDLAESLMADVAENTADLFKDPPEEPLPQNATLRATL